MKQWVKGDHAAASKLDPTIGAIIAAIMDIAVRLDVHTKLGIDEASLLQIVVEVAFLAFLVRSVQTNVLGRKKKAAALPPVESPPVESPPVESPPDESPPDEDPPSEPSG